MKCWTTWKRRLPSKAMYFRNDRLREMWLVKYLKSLVPEHLATVNMLNSLKTCTTALSSYCFINFQKIELENIRLSVSWILRVFVNALSADDKYSLRNSKNLLRQIQLQLSEKQKNFLNFFLFGWKLHQMVGNLKKKMTSKYYVFPKLETAKDVVS